MTETVASARHRRGLRAAGAIFVGMGVLLGALTAMDVLGSIETNSSAGLPGGAVLLVLAAGSALFGRHLLRESARPVSYHRGARLAAAWTCFLISALAGVGTVAMVISWLATGKLSDPIGLVYPASSSLAMAQIGRLCLKNSRRDPPPGEVYEEDLPATGNILYREACSDVNVAVALAAVALMVVGIWVIATFGGSGDGWRGFLIVIPVLPGMWLLFAVPWLPYGIVLREDGLEMGVRGVSPAGRTWLRAVVPLDAIIQWDVVTRHDFKARKAEYRPSRGKPKGAMAGMLMRHLLWVRADPHLIRERFPEYVMPSGYVSTSADEAGYVQNGILYIGTRRPKTLAHAMTMAVPGRRLPRSGHHAFSAQQAPPTGSSTPAAVFRSSADETPDPWDWRTS